MVCCPRFSRALPSLNLKKKRDCWQSKTGEFVCGYCDLKAIQLWNRLYMCQKKSQGKAPWGRGCQETSCIEANCLRVSTSDESGRAVLITFSCTSWPSIGLRKPQRWEGRKGIQRILLTLIEDNHKYVQANQARDS